MRLVRSPNGTNGRADAIFWDPTAGENAFSESGGGLGKDGGVGGAGEFDAVINLCGEPVAKRRWTKRQKARIYRSRINTTHLLAEAMANRSAPLFKSPPKALINASAIGIYGEAGSFLANLCRDWEAAAKPATDAGIRTYFLRIGLVVSKDARFLKLQRPLFRLGLGGWMGNPESWMSWISIRDMVGGVVFLLENISDIEPQALNLTAPNPVSAKDFAKALAASLNRKAHFRIPRIGPNILLGSELVSAILESIKAEPKELLVAGYKFHHPNIESAFDEIHSRS